MAAGVLTRRAALAWGAPPAVALGAGVALVWTGPLTWGALSGMEVSLAAALVAGALLAHARDRTVLTAALAALAALARPEAILLLPALARRAPLSPRGRVLTFAVIAALALAPFVVFCLATVGAPLPATATAKVEGGLVGWLAGVAEPARDHVRRAAVGLPRRVGARGSGTTHWLLPVALLPGARRGVVAPRAARSRCRRWSWSRTRSRWRCSRRIAAPPSRKAGTRCTCSRSRSSCWRSRCLGAWPRAVLAAAAIYLLLALPALVPAATRYGWAVQNINAMQVHLGRWVDRELPRPSRVAVNDIGAIAYFSRREIIDLMGLVTPEIIPYRREGEAGVLRYLVESCPDHVVIFPAWFPQMAARSDLLEPRYRVRLERNEVAGADEMVVYRVKRCAV